MTGQTRTQQQQMCRDFIREFLAGRQVTALDCSQAMQDRWGVYVDWYVFAHALCTLDRYGSVRRQRAPASDIQAVYFVEAVEQ